MALFVVIYLFSHRYFSPTCMEAYAEAPWSRGEPSNSARLFGPSDANMYSEVRDPHVTSFFFSFVTFNRRVK